MIKKLTDNKIIVCSDLHIHNYTDYAPTEKQLETIFSGDFIFSPSK